MISIQASKYGDQTQAKVKASVFLTFDKIFLAFYQWKEGVPLCNFVHQKFNTMSKIIFITGTSTGFGKLMTQTLAKAGIRFWPVCAARQAKTK
jgi:hypothetical protein